MIEEDISNVFCKDDTEFCETLYIGTNSTNKTKAFGSLQTNTINNNAGNTAPLQRFSHSLNCPYADVYHLNIKAGMTIYINDKAFRVVSVTIEMGMLIAILQNS